MKKPKVNEYYEYVFQSYRKQGNDICHQYRINGSVASCETYCDIRSKLYQKGAYIAARYEDCIGHNTLRTTILLLLKKEA